MKRKIVWLGLALVLVLAIAQIAAAAPWGFGLGGKIGGKFDGKFGGKFDGKFDGKFAPGNMRPADYLGLTDEQINKIKELERQIYQNTKDLRSKLEDAVFELKQLWWEKNPDQAAVDAKTKEVNDLRNQFQQAAQENQRKFESILTPEQLEKAKSFRGPGGRGARHRMPGFGGAPSKAPSSETSSQ